MALDLSALDDVASNPLAAGGGMAARAPLSLFEVDPGNPRFEEDPAEFALFVADVRERGILQPIIVRRLDSGMLRIRFGSRRYRAAVELGLPDAPYVVTEDARQFDDYAQVAENQRRARLQPLELATFIARKLSEGETKRTVARRLGLDPSAVTNLLALTGNVPAFLLELYHSRRCRSPKYLYRLRLLWEGHPEAVERACAGIREIDAPFIDEITREGSNQLKGRDGVRPVGRVAAAPTAVQSAAGSAPETGPLSALSEGKGCGSGTGMPERAIGPHLARNNGGSTPQLHGTFNGRDVVLHISMRPTVEGLVFVHYPDSGARCVEIPLKEIALTRLIPRTR